MRKQLRKFVAVHLHFFGQNQHAFWNGTEWVREEEQADFYNSRDVAALTSKDNGGLGDYHSVELMF